MIDVFEHGGKYTVKNGDGAKIANPQALLDTLIGSISFDPLEFARMKSVNQAANLAQITGIDFEELNQRKKEIFDERTDVNREAKRLTASITEIEKDVPDIRQKKPIEEESLESIVAEYDVAKALHLSTDEEVIRLDRFQTSLHRREEELESLKKKVAELENEIHEGWKDVERQATDLKERAKNLPDLEAIKQRMTDASNATVMNSHIKSYAEERSALKDMQQKAAQLSDSIEAIDKKKRDLVSNADLPVNNLTFDETGVFYQGVPFEQCCASEQLKISTAIAISLNPKLRVIRINDGSLLDTENLSVLESIAKKQDFQIWVERVGEDSNGVGILIEDGQVVETVTERSEEENVLP